MRQTLTAVLSAGLLAAVLAAPASASVRDDCLQIAEEESVSLGPEEPGESDVSEMKSEDLRDYLRRLNPEDFGRFIP